LRNIKYFDQQETLSAKEKEMEALKKAIEERLSQSVQVANMKKLLQQKNDLINELREKYAIT
jgi:hypothetical protein